LGCPFREHDEKALSLIEDHVMAYSMLEIDREMFRRCHADAAGYHRTATGMLRNGMKASVVFNLASVALERYLVALCAWHGAMPMNHNYVALMEAAETVADFPADLDTGIRALDDTLAICSLDPHPPSNLTPMDAARVLGYCAAIAAYIEAPPTV